MTDQVSNRFSISSKTLDSSYLGRQFPWAITETVEPNGQINQYITVFNLGAGSHPRVDRHLEAVKQILLKKEPELRSITQDCHFGLWIRYRFPSREGAFNLSPDLLAAFAFLRVEIIFHLNEN